jgi:hypothetical protein
MAAGSHIATLRVRAAEPQLTTLLELVRVISEVTDDEREIVATVTEMLRSGRVRLCGNFRGTPPEEFC